MLAVPPIPILNGIVPLAQPVSRCELVEFPGAKHGFFNRGEAYEKTLAGTDAFLTSLGYLPAK